MFVAYVFLEMYALRGGTSTLAEVEIYTRVTAPVEMTITWLSTIGFQTTFQDKVVLMLFYLTVIRVGLRWGVCWELISTGEPTLTLQIALASTSLFAVYQREKRQKETYIAANQIVKSTDSLHATHATTRASGWHRPTIEYLKFVWSQRFKDPREELAFRRYFTAKLRNETRAQYGISFVSAGVSVVSLGLLYGMEALDKMAIVRLGAIIPAACLLGFLSVSFTGPNHPNRQQLFTAGTYICLSFFSFDNTILNMRELGDTLTGIVRGPKLDFYLASVFFHLNLMMARSSAGILRGWYALACSSVDLCIGLALYVQSGAIMTAYQVLCAYALVALFSGLIIQPWGEKNHRRYWRLVEEKDNPHADDTREAADEDGGERGTGAAGDGEIGMVVTHVLAGTGMGPRKVVGFDIEGSTVRTASMSEIDTEDEV
ncbi:hypothetical protein HKX48_009102 [Thoreauomyces humboldtii]|nr:hypothetical protein HKX48_009102 [Thoreauomyces humboldtii]